MNINVEIFNRNIKLQALGIDWLSSKEQKLLDELNSTLGELNIYISEEFNGFDIGKSKEDILFVYYKDSKHLYVENGKIWMIFKVRYNIMEYKEMVKLIKWWIESTLDLKVVRTFLYGT